MIHALQILALLVILAVVLPAIVVTMNDPRREARRVIKRSRYVPVHRLLRAWREREARQ